MRRRGGTAIYWKIIHTRLTSDQKKSNRCIKRNERGGEIYNIGGENSPGYWRGRPDFYEKMSGGLETLSLWRRSIREKGKNRMGVSGGKRKRLKIDGGIAGGGSVIR